MPLKLLMNSSSHVRLHEVCALLFKRGAVTSTNSAKAPRRTLSLTPCTHAGRRRRPNPKA